MIKRYCDCCGVELTEPLDQATALEFTLGAIKVSTLRAVKGGWNAGDVCMECVKQVVEHGTAKVRTS